MDRQNYERHRRSESRTKLKMPLRGAVAIPGQGHGAGEANARELDNQLVLPVLDPGKLAAIPASDLASPG